MSWFEQFYGRKAGERKEYPPPLNIEEGMSKIVTITEPKVRTVQTSMGVRPVITVVHEGNLYSLWLSRQSLAEKIALLEQEKGDLTGVKVQITNVGKRGRMYLYEVEVVT